MSVPAKVLVIDDDADLRAAVRSMLESKGYAVAEAESGKDGLRKVVEEKPDLILLDVMMECDSEGYGVTYTIKHSADYELYRGVPVIMMSSIQESPDELFSMSPESEMIRPDRYLAKPVDMDLLLEVVEKALAERPPRSVANQ